MITELMQSAVRDYAEHVLRLLGSISEEPVRSDALVVPTPLTVPPSPYTSYERTASLPVAKRERFYGRHRPALTCSPTPYATPNRPAPLMTREGPTPPMSEEEEPAALTNLAEEEWVLPSPYNYVLVASSQLLLLSAFAARARAQRSVLTIVDGSLWATSVNHWRRPRVTGWARTADVLVVFVDLLVHMYYAWDIAWLAKYLRGCLVLIAIFAAEFVICTASATTTTDAAVFGDPVKTTVMCHALLHAVSVAAAFCLYAAIAERDHQRGARDECLIAGPPGPMQCEELSARAGVAPVLATVVLIGTTGVTTWYSSVLIRQEGERGLTKVAGIFSGVLLAGYALSVCIDG